MTIKQTVIDFLLSRKGDGACWTTLIGVYHNASRNHRGNGPAGCRIEYVGMALKKILKQHAFKRGPAHSRAPWVHSIYRHATPVNQVNPCKEINVNNSCMSTDDKLRANHLKLMEAEKIVSDLYAERQKIEQEAAQVEFVRQEARRINELQNDIRHQILDLLAAEKEEDLPEIFQQLSNWCLAQI